MLPRLLLILLFLVGAPASTIAAGHCCEPVDECCADPESECPTLPGGECALSVAGQADATTAPAPVQAPSFAAARIEQGPAPFAVAAAFHLRPPPGSSTPRFLRLRTLRI